MSVAAKRHNSGDKVDLGSLSTACLPIDLSLVTDFAQTHYGLSGDFRRLDTEKDDTFLVSAGDGRRYILKFANPGETHAELDLQVATLLHLERHAPDLPVPRVLPDNAGAHLPEFEAQDGLRHVRLMSYLSGTVLDTLPPMAAEQVEIGRMLARLRLAMADFTHPEAQRVLAWDVRHLPQLGGLLDHVADPAQHALLSQGFERFCDQAGRIEALPRQVVHNDFSRSNLLVDRNGPPGVVGVIDFGDVVDTAIAIDLSTGFLNQLPRGPHEGLDDMLAGPRNLLAGYREVASLTPEELSLLPHLVMGRAVLRALLSMWRAAQFPDNSRYILRNTEQGWAQLDWFMSKSPDELSDLLS